MPKKHNLIGMRFGKLTVIQDSGKRASNGGILWECQCDCGNITLIAGSNLTRKNNATQSCGCKTNAIDLTGQRFNKLVAIKPTNMRSNNKVVWQCQCDCGKEHFVSSSNLVNGSVQSCGCSKYDEKNQDLIGKVFGNLIVIDKVKDNNSEWVCQCSCGEIVTVTGTNLTRGNNTSCGNCFQNLIVGTKINNWTILEKTDKKKNNYWLYKCKCDCGNIQLKTISELKNLKGEYCSNCHLQDLTGNKYEKLLVVSYDHTFNGKSYWKCLCDCGNTTIVSHSNLESGSTKSCGCLNKSAGELKIERILKENNISYETQKKFDTCRFPDTNGLARFDFYLPEYNCLIEYDGQQHFKEVPIWNSLSETQKRDTFKTEWCKQNNILLIRIPYTMYKDLTIKNLLPFVQE